VAPSYHLGVQPLRTRALAAAVVVTATISASLVVAPFVSGATTSPGTPAQVAALVAAAPSITALPANLTPPLSSAGNDDALTEYPALNSCIGGTEPLSSCTFGDVHGKRTMVLFGDSHALMWFPALDAVATAAKWRLIALMQYACPVADVSVWDVVSDSPDYLCPVFRAQTIKRIDKLDPKLLVVSENVLTLDARDKVITDAEWTKALEKSLGLLHAKSMRRVVIGQDELVPNPVACLAQYPSAVQTCSRPEAAPGFLGQLAADRAAARDEKVPYLNEMPWLCSATCTDVIGNMVVYNSTGHLSATYDTYLTDVMRLALSSSMR
jgi:SGNH domain (fused to AT3 domains)